MSSGDKIDEANIIEKILKFSEFEKFYRAEWETRKISVYGMIDPSLEAFAAQDFDEEGRPYILLKHIPTNFDDAFLVAHEIEHVIRYFDKKCLKIQINFPTSSKYTNDELVDLAKRLGTMFDDPVIDSFLQREFRFKPAIFYIKVKIPETTHSVNSSGDQVNELTRFKRAMFYSQCALQWDSIKNANSVRKWKDLKKLYQEKRPIVTSMGEELYSMAKENGYDTMEEQISLFGKIVDKYTIDGIKLSEILCINTE